MEILKKIFELLTPSERKKSYLLLLLIIIMALLDTLGIASILPFMTLLTNPELLETNVVLIGLYKIANKFGINEINEFVLILGILTFTLLILSLTVKAITTYAQLRFTLMREFSIGKRLVEGYLHQPYSWFLNRNSADLGKTILSEVDTIIGRGVTPMMELISRGMVSIALIILLLLVDTKLTIIVGFIIGGAYGLIFYFTNNYLKRIGGERLTNNKLRFIAISESFGAIKEVKVGGLEKTYIEQFSKPARTFATHQSTSALLAQMPRFFFEAIAFGGILLMILYLMIQTGSFNKALPIISLYVFAGYRLIPAFQQIYVSFNQLSFVGASLDFLYNDLKSLKHYQVDENQNKLFLNNSITLKQIYYNYPNNLQSTLKNINMNIAVNTTVGIVGATGSGKTTTVDIILGLLEAHKGSLEVDGQVITKNNFRAWQRSIGYVPQHIYLSDDTVAANIAFGIKPKDIDKTAVEKASKIANLHEFVMNELSNNYNTTVGERGIRLSGGQRQRIGIARALYHNPQILVLDEATSALDSYTESVVMDAIENLGKNKTVILIAHRLSTVKKCDKIFFLEEGQIKKEGTFEQLITTDYKFRNNKSN